jgi:hypothetical protein
MKIIDILTLEFRDKSNYQVIELENKYPLTVMQKNAITNFVYILNKKGYLVAVTDYTISDDVVPLMYDTCYCTRLIITLDKNAKL